MKMWLDIEGVDEVEKTAEEILTHIQALKKLCGNLGYLRGVDLYVKIGEEKQKTTEEPE